METCRCAAVILGTTDYRETDRLVTLFTRELGRVRGVARGAKRSQRRFGGALELFARIDLHIVPSEGLCRLQSADVVSIFPGIRGDLERIALAGYACELADCLTPEGVPYPRLFRLLTACLEHLDTAPASLADRRFFEINLLNILGYRPPLDTCGRCDDTIIGADPLFVGAGGHLLCGRCGGDQRRISGATVASLRQALKTGRFGVLSFDGDGAAEAGIVLDPLIASHIRRPLKSLAFLRETEQQSS
jgi:DNA repair protein RecO (recombination protein O)